MTDRELLLDACYAYEALAELGGMSDRHREAYKKLRTRIEQLEPWVKTYSGGKPNYTQPKEWISLTDDEIADVFGDYMDSADETEEEEHNWDYERLIEAKVKEKNGYLKEEK